ncbi:MAG: right-handed parallel beta-helix repeat-containing protein [Candidatus Marinimicrobia bacterium]|nr:right-handed parallel beta-helix repeat-containing protein [Candidatus Neomarinimicrobiota bacterium]
MIDSAFVTLTWPLVGIDDFTALEITRSYIEPWDDASSEGVLRTRITSPNVNTWQDTIYDDESLRYTILVLSSQGPLGQSEVVVDLPPTTSLIVANPSGDPELSENLIATILSPLIDSGDSVLVYPGNYFVSQLDFSHKAIHLMGVQGAGRTYLNYIVIPTEPGRQPPPAVMLKMKGGLLEGFTIRDGVSLQGGGVHAAGSAVIRQCVFDNNRAINDSHTNDGYGGGIYLEGTARVQNCLVINNLADITGGGIYISEQAVDVRIINSTIYGNRANGQGGGITRAFGDGAVLVQNSIIIENEAANIYPSAAGSNNSFRVLYSLTDAEWAAADSTNIVGDPLFIDPQRGDFHLDSGSVAINAGDPDASFNDPDGSRNDLGAYGGPWGQW